VFVKDSRSAPAATREVRAALADQPGIEVLPWGKAMPELAEFIWFDDASMWVFNIILIVIIGIGVLNTILMSVMERTREIGVMRGLGMSGGSVVGLVMTEAALIGLIGIALGWALAAPAVHYLTHTGIDIAALTGAEAEIGGVAISNMKARLYLSRALMGTGIVLGMALLAGLYPAVRAARIQVLKAIQNV
jgi:ABC-type lipoprotein release transport system permease subunit